MAARAKKTNTPGKAVPVRGCPGVTLIPRAAGANGVKIFALQKGGSKWTIDYDNARVWHYPPGEYATKCSISDLNENKRLIDIVRSLEKTVKGMKLKGDFKSCIQKSKKFPDLFNITAKWSDSFHLSNYDKDRVSKQPLPSTAYIQKIQLLPVVYASGRFHGVSLKLICAMDLEQKGEDDVDTTEAVECQW
jgi:hypothetical protein